MQELNQPTTVVHAATVAVDVPGEPVVLMPALLHYDRADPYAVLLSLGAPETEPVDWVFARSLLAEGMRRPSGVGRVLVNPPHRCHRDSVRIVVRSAHRAALIEVRTTDVREFLRRSYALVPDGKEYIDVDGALAVLMDSCD
ncbi:Sporulation-specific cell division protein SsgB [Streptomyces sp. RB5]|uniref:Sporulation-specific cell division protein SsgB n=1 Tax=Streptomyces smaragdinus TaxID=2585196 RepID=A0A7K0CM12_9ACTN|nr:SsgA family sporulation/cell division regulator [Streptomyces smaragdinus]MQY14528.1 Sporulation-specific cell division protein SsgB [Streptomyces smaragdinus]